MTRWLVNNGIEIKREEPLQSRSSLRLIMLIFRIPVS